MQTCFTRKGFKGKLVDKASNIDNAHLSGIHLALPGYNNNLPTLEIFQYDSNLNNLDSQPNRKGYGHIAFKVDNVREVLTRLLENGGTKVGEIVTTQISNSGQITFVYAKDIDGNIIEIQNWK
jgi:catechol 2,3-dioxygenase-like lactoylglutathione lyase family enzyme